MGGLKQYLNAFVNLNALGIDDKPFFLGPRWGDRMNLLHICKYAHAVVDLVAVGFVVVVVVVFVVVVVDVFVVLVGLVVVAFLLPLSPTFI